MIVEEVRTKKSSLESKCPHVVRALKLYVQMTEGRGVLLAHPLKGMTKTRLLEIALNGTESRRMSICGQDVYDIGFAYFPCTFQNSKEPRHTVCSDMLALLGMEGWHQDDVLQKVESFLRRIARRALVDLHRIHEYKNEVAAMWFAPASKNPSSVRVHCDEVGLTKPLCSYNVYKVIGHKCCSQCSSNVVLPCLGSCSSADVFVFVVGQKCLNLGM